MKKLTILATLMFATYLLNASLAFDIGFYAPKDSKVSVLWGLENFWEVDERVSLGMSGNFYYKTYKDRYMIIPGNSAQGIPPTYATDTDIRTVYLPLYAGFKVHIPIENVLVIPFVGADFGWGFSWHHFDKDIDGFSYKDDRFYHGFTWKINGGVTYPLGSKSDVYVKMFWNSASYERSTGVKEWDEFNLSGFSAALGIRFKY